MGHIEKGNLKRKGRCFHLPERNLII